jgi:hypothetical protein
MVTFRIRNKIHTDEEIVQIKFLSNKDIITCSLVALTDLSNILVYDIGSKFEGELTLSFNSLFGKNKIT